MQDVRLSDYGIKSTVPSPVSKMMASFAADFRENYDVNLGVGYVNNKTIPQNKILKALEQVINTPEKYRSAFNYGGPSGSLNLINSLKNFILRNNIGGFTKQILDSKKVIIGASSATSILESIAQVVKPGVVITSDPMYYIYCNYLERMGFKVISIPEDKNGIITEPIENKIKDYLDNISFFYIVTIGNPSSSILSNSRRKKIVDIVNDLSLKIERKIPLIWDTAYELLVHDNNLEKPESAIIHDKQDTVYEIGTMSKVLAPGLRVGYMIGPDSNLMKALIQRTNDIGFSGPLINQEIASYFLDNHIEEQISNVNKGYQIKAKKVEKHIKEKLGIYLEEVIGGKAGFYYYLTFKNINTDENSDFYKYCSRITGKIKIDYNPDGSRKNRTIYIPGEFCVNPKGDLIESGKRQLRISYGFEDTESIIKGIKIFKEACEYSSKNKYIL